MKNSEVEDILKRLTEEENSMDVSHEMRVVWESLDIMEMKEIALGFFIAGLILVYSLYEIRPLRNERSSLHIL